MIKTKDRLLSLLLSIAVIFSLLVGVKPTSASAADSKPSPIESVTKTITPVPGEPNSWWVEAAIKTKSDVVQTPTDIVVILDYSTNMQYDDAWLNVQGAYKKLVTEIFKIKTVDNRIGLVLMGAPNKSGDEKKAGAYYNYSHIAHTIEGASKQSDIINASVKKRNQTTLALTSTDITPSAYLSYKDAFEYARKLLDDRYIQDKASGDTTERSRMIIVLSTGGEPYIVGPNLAANQKADKDGAQQVIKDLKALEAADPTRSKLNVQIGEIVNNDIDQTDYLKSFTKIDPAHITHQSIATASDVDKIVQGFTDSIITTVDSSKYWIKFRPGFVIVEDNNVDPLKTTPSPFDSAVVENNSAIGSKITWTNFTVPKQGPTDPPTLLRVKIRMSGSGVPGGGGGSGSGVPLSPIVEDGFEFNGKEEFPGGWGTVTPEDKNLVEFLSGTDGKLTGITSFIVNSGSKLPIGAVPVATANDPVAMDFVGWEPSYAPGTYITSVQVQDKVINEYTTFRAVFKLKTYKVNYTLGRSSFKTPLPAGLIQDGVGSYYEMVEHGKSPTFLVNPSFANTDFYLNNTPNGVDGNWRLGLTSKYATTPEIKKMVITSPIAFHYIFKTNLVFELNGGTVDGSGDNIIKNVDIGGLMGPAPTPPVKPGSTFTKWVLKDDMVTPYYPAINATDGGHVYVAQFDTAKYNITFSTDARGTLSHGSSYSLSHGDKLPAGTVKDPVVANTKEYEFAGWKTPSGNILTSAQVEGTAATENINYTAEYKKKAYNVTFVANGGTLGTTPATQTISYGEAPTGVNTVSVPGKTFKGWIKEGAVPATVLSNADVMNKALNPITGDTKYIAQWEDISVKVTFNVNGGNLASTPAQQVIAYGSAPVKPSNPSYINATRIFAGWSETVGGSVIDITTKTLTADKTYYAVWSPVTFNVTFDKNTTAVVSNMPANQTIITGNFANASAIPVHSDTAYDFKGWMFTPAGPATCNVATYPIVVNTVFYAKWELVQYNITFVAGDPSGRLNGNNANITLTAKRNSTVTAPTATYITAEKEFVGWKNSGGAILTTAQVNALPVTKTETYTAQFKTKEFKVSFDAASGNLAGTPTPQTVLYGNAPSGVVNPTNANAALKFLGWRSSTAAPGSAPISSADVMNKTLKPITSDVTYVAVWDTKSYAITFMPGDGTLVGGTPNVVKDVNHGSPIGTPPVANPNDSNKEFGGWKDPAGNIYTTAEISSKPASSDVTYTAVYVLKKYEVKFETSPGSIDGSTGMTATQMIEHGSKPIVVNAKPADASKVFLGWKRPTDANPRTSAEVATDVITAPVTYTAVFADSSYTITYEVSTKYTSVPVAIAQEKVSYGKSPLNIRDITGAEILALVDFKGWQINGTGQIYSTSEVIAMKIYSNTKFVASFKSQGPSIIIGNLKNSTSTISSGQWSIEKVTQEFIVNSGVGLSSVTVTGPGGYSKNVLGAGLPLNTSFNDVVINGTYTITAVDKDGEKTTATVVISALDFTKPVISGANAGIALSKDNWSTVLTYNDPVGGETGTAAPSGIKSGSQEIVLYPKGTFDAYGGNQAAIVAGATPIASGDMSTALSSVMTDEYDVFLTVMDNAGNKTLVMQKDVTVSNGATPIQIDVVYDKTTWTNTNVTATYTITTKTPIKSVKVDGVAVGTSKNGAIVFNANKDSTIEVETLDGSKNSSQAKVTWIDKLAPEVKIDPSVVKLIPTLLISSDDRVDSSGANGTSGTVSTTFKLFREGEDPNTTTPVRTSDSLSSIIVAAPNGKVFLVISATDAAGNTETVRTGTLISGTGNSTEFKMVATEGQLLNLASATNIKFISPVAVKITIKDGGDNVVATYPIIFEGSKVQRVIRPYEFGITLVGGYDLVFEDANDGTILFIAEARFI